LEQENLMKRCLAAAAMAVALTTGSAAQAFSLPAQPAPVQTDVQRVAGGCGLGWHRGPYGGCRPNVAYYGGWRYAAYPYPGRCWWTVTPYGSRRVCAW
jgi:hypothetical protein